MYIMLHPIYFIIFLLIIISFIYMYFNTEQFTVNTINEPNKPNTPNESNKSNTTIILTSTVNVNLNKSYLFQTCKNERLETYLKSVLQWLNKTKFNIILVENSGYNFDELNNEKILYKDRFEVITFKESELDEAKYISNNNSKGASEVFAINYAFNHSKIIKKSNFIIKITGRYFIPELEEYISKYDLNNYDCLTQYNRDRCEMVGSHYKNFSVIFNINLINKNNYYDGHIENIWKERTSSYKNILICKKFTIERTQRGGLQQYFNDI